MKSYRLVDVKMFPIDETKGHAKRSNQEFPSMPAKPGRSGFRFVTPEQAIRSSIFSGFKLDATSVGLLTQNHTGDLAE
ncbi:hypothetical protein [Ferribacterium limneticum]|uniref:hypothetical protein n=1 Tax=Ferribacterium limneticum TaxID=76259 RepID=UPI001CF8D079|nr:hypothetical protein [Ferribacterium limneticum]UCV24322.1 hypothetical protein KI613_07385 [Ferribacterium limneticum]